MTTRSSSRSDGLAAASNAPRFPPASRPGQKTKPLLRSFAVGLAGALTGFLGGGTAAEPVAGDDAATISIDGFSVPYRSVTISSPVQEILAEVFVEEGDTVRKDQPLAQLFDEKERIEFRRFEKLLEKRKFDQQASKNLLEGNLLSKEKALAAEAELELAQVDYDLAKVKLEEKTIDSTVDGIVIRRMVEPGESVDRIQPLFEIVNIDQLTLQFYVEPSLLAHLAIDDRVPFFLTGSPDKRGEGVVDFISPSADPESGLFRIKLTVNNPDHRFLAGVRVTGEFSRAPENAAE